MRYYFSSRRGIDTGNEAMMRFPLDGNEFAKLFESCRCCLSTREISRAGISLRKNCRAIRLRRNYAKHSETLENRMERRANDSFDPLRRNFVTSELLSIFCSYCDEIKHLDTLVVISEGLILYRLLWTSSKVV